MSSFTDLVLHKADSLTLLYRISPDVYFFLFILIVLVWYLYFKTLHVVSFLKAQNRLEENSSLRKGQCEFCFAWKSSRSAWLSFCFIRIKPIGIKLFLCTKYTSILEINDIFSVKAHSYEYICHCMFLCGIIVFFLLIWPSNHEVEYMLECTADPINDIILKTVFLLRIRLFSTKCKT